MGLCALFASAFDNAGVPGCRSNDVSERPDFIGEVMEEEKEFSFGYFVRYSLRRWFIILLCMILGAIAGALYVISYKVTNYEAWERSVYFNTSKYYDAVTGGAANLQQGDYSKYKDETNRVYQLLFVDEPIIKMQVFEYIKNDANFYPKMDDELEKMNKFFADFHVSERTNTLVVRYVFDVKSDDQTAARRDMVQKAVNVYIEKVIERLKKDPSFAADPTLDVKVLKVETVSRAFVNSDEDKTFASNSRPSLTTTIVICVLAGFVLAMVIVLIRYVTDKRVKSVKELLPADKSEVVTTGDDDHTDAYVSLAAKLNVAGVRRPLLASVYTDEFAKKFVNGFVDYCRGAGVKVKLVSFGDKETDWHEYFVKGESAEDDNVLYLYDGADNAVIEYLSVYADGVCILLNQGAANKKHFLGAVENAKNGKYVCTVVYNVSESWLE